MTEQASIFDFCEPVQWKGFPNWCVPCAAQGVHTRANFLRYGDKMPLCPRHIPEYTVGFS